MWISSIPSKTKNVFEIWLLPENLAASRFPTFLLPSQQFTRHKKLKSFFRLEEKAFPRATTYINKPTDQPATMEHSAFEKLTNLIEDAKTTMPDSDYMELMNAMKTIHDKKFFAMDENSIRQQIREFLAIHYGLKNVEIKSTPTTSTYITPEQLARDFGWEVVKPKNYRAAKMKAQEKMKAYAKKSNKNINLIHL